MSLHEQFRAKYHTTLASVAFLLLRIVVGIAFMKHGWGKIQHPFNWMGPESTTPAIFQGLAALSEFGGGFALVMGLLTPLASLGIASTMAVATYSHMILWRDPFVSKGGGGSYELAAVYFCISFVLLTQGPGGFSLDRIIFGKK